MPKSRKNKFTIDTTNIDDTFSSSPNPNIQNDLRKRMNQIRIVSYFEINSIENAKNNLAEIFKTNPNDIVDILTIHVDNYLCMAKKIKNPSEMQLFEQHNFTPSMVEKYKRILGILLKDYLKKIQIKHPIEILKKKLETVRPHLNYCIPGRTFRKLGNIVEEDRIIMERDIQEMISDQRRLQIIKDAQRYENDNPDELKRIIDSIFNLYITEKRSIPDEIFEAAGHDVNSNLMQRQIRNYKDTDETDFMIKNEILREAIIRAGVHAIENMLAGDSGFKKEDIKIPYIYDLNNFTPEDQLYHTIFTTHWEKTMVTVLLEFDNDFKQLVNNEIGRITWGTNLQNTGIELKTKFNRLSDIDIKMKMNKVNFIRLIILNAYEICVKENTSFFKL
jgi:hypothetical protein